MCTKIKFVTCFLSSLFSLSDTVQDNYIGFDWFTAVVFLIMCQSHDITWQFMKDFSQLLVSGYLWMPRLHLSVSHMHTYSCIHTANRIQCTYTH